MTPKPFGAELGGCRDLAAQGAGGQTTAERLETSLSLRTPDSLAVCVEPA